MPYGSLREHSYSRLPTFEAARLLEAMGGEMRVFDPSGLPLPDGAPESHRSSKNCGVSQRGPRAWCGALQSATAR